MTTYAEITVGRASAVTALRLSFAYDSIEETLAALAQFKLGGQYFGDLIELRVERIGLRPMRKVEYVPFGPELLATSSPTKEPSAE